MATQYFAPQTPSIHGVSPHCPHAIDGKDRPLQNGLNFLAFLRTESVLLWFEPVLNPVALQVAR